MPSRNDEYMKQALSYYENTWLWLITIHNRAFADYKALEIEAEKWSKLIKLILEFYVT
jgi:hypothetical protein